MNLVYKYLAVVSLNLVCYYQSLSGDYVFDDSVAIVKNRDVNNGLSRETLQNVFQNDFWGNNLKNKDSHKSFRPLTTLSFTLQRQINGNLDSRSMKTINLFIHIINCCLLFNFLEAIIADKKTHFFAILMFSVHPIHCEAVCGIVSRSDLMACLTFLISGIVYFNVFHKDSTAFKSKHIFNLISVVTLASVGVLFKENAIMIMPTIVVIDFIRNLKRLQLLPKTLLIRLSVLSFFTVVLLVLRLKIQNFEAPKFREEDNPMAFSKQLLTRILSQNYLYVLNFFLLIMPDWLCFDWSFNSIKMLSDFGDYRNVFIVIFYIFLVILTVKGLKRRKILIVLSLIIVPFLPASGILKVGFVIAERILYIPSIGFSLLVAIGLRNLIKNFPGLKFFFYVMFGIFLTFHSLKSYQRSLEWSTEHRLFYSALKVVPGNAKVYYNIARLSSDIKDVETSVKFYRKAIQLHPNYESAYMNLGNLYREINEHQKAKFHLKKAVEILEEFPTAWMNLGIVQNVMKEHQAAEASYFKALSYRKNYANCFYNLGNLYIDTKNFTSAIASWKRAISINPVHKKAWSNILAYYDNQINNHEDVLKYSELALNYLPNDSNILFSRANTLGKLSRFEEAETIFKQIIQAEPRKSIFYANLGVLYHRWGKKDLAKRNYKLALSLDANLKNAQSNLSKLQDVN